MSDNKQKKRAALHVLIDVEILRRLYAEPIAPMTISGVGTLPPRAAWKKYVADVVLKHQRSFIVVLDRYRELLTEDERSGVESYRRSVKRFESDWRNGPIPYPEIPAGFDTLLQN